MAEKDCCKEKDVVGCPDEGEKQEDIAFSFPHVRPKKNVLFTEGQRRLLEEAIKDETSNPKRAVDKMEQAICASIVFTCKKLGMKLAEDLSRKLAAFLN